MWILPSYNRPQQLQTLLDRCVETGLVLPGVILLGADQAQDRDALRLPAGWTAILQNPEDIGVGKVVNRYVVDHLDHDWYGIICDDHWPVSMNWEKPIYDAAMLYGIASCDDGFQSPKRIHGPTIWRGDVVRATEFLWPPTVRHSYADDFWEFAGRAFGIWKCIMDVKVEHRHPGNKSGQMDEIYLRQMKWMTDDHAAMAAWTSSPAFKEAMDRIKAAVEGGPRVKPG